jgi:hypothetical protein
MAATPSTMRALGSPLPAFDLPDPRTNEQVSDAILRRGGPAVVAFICNHCPFVVHIRQGLIDFGGYARERGVAFVAISSNDAETYPQDGPERMAADAERFDYPFAYLYDETQSTARAFDAACTPDFFVFDGTGRLAYRGQFDAARPGNGKPVTGTDLRAAVDALLAGTAPNAVQTPSIGCNIKWRR